MPPQEIKEAASAIAGPLEPCPIHLTPPRFVDRCWCGYYICSTYGCEVETPTITSDLYEPEARAKWNEIALLIKGGYLNPKDLKH